MGGKNGDCKTQLTCRPSPFCPTAKREGNGTRRERGMRAGFLTGFPQFVSLKQEKFALMSNFVESLPVQRTKKTEFSPCSQEFSVLVRCRLQAPKMPILDCNTRRRIQKRLLPRTNNSPACNTRLDTIRVRPAAKHPAVSPCKKVRL